MKNKISYLPFNLFWSLSTFCITYVVLALMTNLNEVTVLLLSAGFYISRVDNNVTEDYLNDKIKELEKNSK